MNQHLKEFFLERWARYCPGAELPLVWYYTDEKPPFRKAPETKEWRCVICDLQRARRNEAVYFDKDSIGCGGGKRYFGFDREPDPDLDYFLSCGIPGKFEGIRYKKNPELVAAISDLSPDFQAGGRYLVFKSWSELEDEDEPRAVVFFAAPDVLSALFTLVNFDESDTNAVISPAGSGCSSILYFPLMESRKAHPRAILGMFDISARPCVGSDILTLAVPWKKMSGMIANMDESFLITESWRKIKSRLTASRKND